MARFKNVNWNVKPATGDDNAAYNCEEANLAVLMDIRDELQQLNRLLGCHNFVTIPNVLRDIRKNTTKTKRQRRLKVAK